MKKIQLILIIGIGVVVILGGIIGWALIQKPKIPPAEEDIQKEEEVKEIFSLSGIVSGVNAENNFLMVKPAGEEKEVKVLISETTKMIKLEFPFDPANPPKEATFTPERIPITIDDLEAGDNVLIETNINIYGKTEFNDVSRIQALP